MARFLQLALFVLPSIAAPAAMAQPYVNLLKSSDLNHWMKPSGDPVTDGWNLESGGVLHLAGKGGHIISRQKYGDFELWFEFRIAAKGNSGVKYRVQHYGKQLLGIEYQILDDKAFPKLTRDHLTASLYDLVTPISDETRLNGDDEFNIGKIRVRNNRVQHWVNGQLTIDEPLCGSRWQAHVAGSKFSNKEDFGENVTGHIMLTDHGSEVWYRNMFIRSLDCCDSVLKGEHRRRSSRSRR
ncbi:MAG: DUF1080 domain-containing protein [Fuerstiella sp.]|nr:DUF1080 domain-containing protein [Fuerstiella sp.]